MRKSLIDRFFEYLQNVAVWTFFVTVSAIFVVSAAVTLTFVWIYTRR
jgi:hypothetical protein